jgi:RNA polymerase sigma-70 factor, ECF subfamily
VSVTSEMAYEDLRPLMFSIAYRMLGSVADAEDIVQEAFLRYHRAVDGGAPVESAKAYLSAVTTRLTIDHLRSARVRREAYVGPWLPEPLLTDPATPDPAAHAEIVESLSMAFLLLLERLNPVERAVFLLHDVFSFGYGEIAEIVGKSPQNCRQLASRARRHVAEHKPRFEASRAQRDELADRFFATMGDGDMQGLLDLVAAAAAVHGDSGGTPPSWPRPIVGREHVSRVVAGLGRQIVRFGVTVHRAEINGQPGALFRDPDGRLISAFCLEIADGVVQTVRSVINPEKLRHLGPLSDLRGPLRQRRDG